VWHLLYARFLSLLLAFTIIFTIPELGVINGFRFGVIISLYLSFLILTVGGTKEGVLFPKLTYISADNYSVHIKLYFG